MHDPLSDMPDESSKVKTVFPVIFTPVATTSLVKSGGDTDAPKTAFAASVLEAEKVEPKPVRPIMERLGRQVTGQDLRVKPVAADAVDPTKAVSSSPKVKTEASSATDDVKSSLNESPDSPAPVGENLAPVVKEPIDDTSSPAPETPETPEQTGETEQPVEESSPSDLDSQTSSFLPL